MSEVQSVGVIGLGSMGMGAAKSCVKEEAAYSVFIRVSMDAERN